MKKFSWLLTTIVSVVIVVLSTIPIPEEAPLADVPLIDKWVHFLMYGGLSMVMWMDGVRSLRKLLPAWFFLLTFAYPILLGGLLELVQAYWTTCRSGDWWDFVADSIGAVLGTVVAIIAQVLWKEKISALR